MVLIFSVCNLQGQKEGNIWMFGDHAGLDFNSGEPIAVTYNKMYQKEGCASISDIYGNLLFYTNGKKVYTSSGLVMPNGSNLTGHQSSTQSAIIARLPNSQRYYYIFTIPDLIGTNFGLRYSIVDIELNNGKGDVISSNNHLASPTEQKITGVTHKNGVDIWIITHLWDSDEFRSYLLTSDTINKIPVISNVGSMHAGDASLTHGYMKASPDGSKIAIVTRINNSIELFDFDNETGKLSNPITFLPYYPFAYGIEFSPNGNMLYVSDYGASSSVYQFDLTGANNSEIINSALKVGTVENSEIGALQVGPDSKIYISKHDNLTGDSYLGVINHPEERGNLCDFVEDGLYLGGKRCLWGLPTFIQSYFFQLQNFSYSNSCKGDTIEFSVSNKENLDSLQWNFDDIASGVDNISTELDPFHIFSASDTFEVQLISYFETNTDTLVKNIIIHNKPIIDFGQDTTICTNDTLILESEFADDLQYTWQDGSTSNTYNVIADGTYWLEAHSVAECSDSDTITIQISTLPEVNIGNDTILTFGSPFTLDAGDNMQTYLWQDGTDEQFYFVEDPDIYWVDVFDGLCYNSDTINIDFVSNCHIYFPNAFTPNNDSHNDFFYPIPNEFIGEFELLIMDRWGEIIFRTTNINDKWDGNFQGILLPMGAYCYIVSYNCYGAFEKKTAQGTVMLIR